MATIKTNEVETAFEITLEEIEEVIEAINQETFTALGKREFDKSLELVEVARQMTEFRDRVKQLQMEWGKLARVKYISKSSKTKKRSRRRLSKGLRTPENVFRIPILRALVKLGGTATVSEVLEEIAEPMAPLLNSYDYSLLSSSDLPRWQNTAQWARYEMVKEGLIAAESPRGIWEITQRGRDFLKKHTSEGIVKQSRLGAEAKSYYRDVPLGLLQVIEVCQEVYHNQMSYNDAVKKVARRRNLKSVHTVYDACTRRIAINTEHFKRLLQDKSQLREYLISRYPDHEGYIVSALK